MIFQALAIPGAFSISIEPHVDERGFFARLWCRDEFASHGIAIDVLQASLSHNRRAGTLRGMHYSRPPSNEGKLVRCQRGRAYDVILDIRAGSPAWGRHVAIELDAAANNAVWIPPGVAHGFQTLEADTDVAYMMSDVFRPELSEGVRFDDPTFGIRWPLPVSVISERDRCYRDFRGALAGDSSH